MSSSAQVEVCLSFALNVEDGWPPVAVESLPFHVMPEGYVALVPPLFVKDLSVGDIIDATLDDAGRRVASWRHVVRSAHTTIWLLRMRGSETIEVVLDELRRLGCNTVGLEESGCYSVDVPESVEIETVDAALEHLDADSVAVAFPSMRHHEG